VTITACILAALLSRSDYSFREEIYINATEPTQNPIEYVNTHVEKNGEHSRDRHYFSFCVTYHDKEYRVNRNPRKKGIEDGMPITVIIQQGSKGIPVIRGITATPKIIVKKKSAPDSKEKAKQVHIIQKGKRGTGKDWINGPAYSQWIKKRLFVNGTDCGIWMILESTSVDTLTPEENVDHSYAKPTYGMALAYQSSGDERVIFFIGERLDDEHNGYGAKDCKVDGTIRVYLGQQRYYFHPRRNKTLSGVWELNNAESRQFIQHCKETDYISIATLQSNGRIDRCHLFEFAE
jgi:hypothetical protein